MQRIILVVTILLVASATAAPRTAGGEGMSSSCKSGNLLQENDPSRIEEMGHFLDVLKAGITKGDKRAVARMARYPLPFATADAQFTIHSEQEFVKKYDQILPPQLRELLLKQEARCISRVGAKGFTIGTGEIWFDQTQEGKVKILGVTAVVYPSE